MLHIDDAERIPGHGFDWRPLRKALGTTGFGVNAYSAHAGGEVIEPAASFNGKLDVGIKNGQVVSVEPGLDRQLAATVIDATGKR